MCHDDASRPPLPADAGTVASTDPDLRLTSADGASLMAHLARAGEPTGAGIVVLPDVRGLHTFYRALAEGFASLGVDAVAIDYFARTAPDDDRSDDFEFMPHVQQTTPEQIAADVAAAAEHLRTVAGVDKVFTVGFCFGGGNSWRLAGTLPGLAGCIGFYGRPTVAGDPAAATGAPLLMLPAGADQHIPVQEVLDYAAQVDAAGGQAQVHVYEGKPHSFFDRTFAEHADACQDAWTRMRAFITEH